MDKPMVALFEGDSEGEGLRLLGRTDNARLVRLVRERIEKDEKKREAFLAELRLINKK